MDTDWKDFCWAALALTVDSYSVFSLKERILIVGLFLFIPNQGSRDLPKEEKPSGRFFLT